MYCSRSAKKEGTFSIRHAVRCMLFGNVPQKRSNAGKREKKYNMSKC